MKFVLSSLKLPTVIALALVIASGVAGASARNKGKGPGAHKAPRFLLEHLEKQMKAGNYKTNEVTQYLEFPAPPGDVTFFVRPDGSVIGYQPNIDGRGHTKMTFSPLKQGDEGKFVVEKRWYRKPLYMVDASDNTKRLERPMYQNSAFEVMDANGNTSSLAAIFGGGYQVAGVGHKSRLREEDQNRVHDGLAVSIWKVREQAKPIADDRYGQVRIFDTATLFPRSQTDVLWDELNYQAQKIATGKKVFSILGDVPGANGYDPDVPESLWEAFAPYLHWGMTEANRFYKARNPMAQGLLIPDSAVLALNFRAGDDEVKAPVQANRHEVVQMGTLGGANVRYFPGMGVEDAKAHAQTTPTMGELFPSGSTAFFLGKNIDELPGLTYVITPSKGEHKKAIQAIVRYRRE